MITQKKLEIVINDDRAREANTAGSEVILWQDYTQGCSPAPYWGDWGNSIARLYYYIIIYYIEVIP